ncbi:MAG: histidinol phosphate phosphatase domain-containing protein [Thermodesulfobacteriota bacterium]
MVDLHTHTLLSDGVLLPAELVRRAQVLGAKAVAITDHADISNLEVILPQIVSLANQVRQTDGITLIPGIELTYVPPDQISAMAQKARMLGANLVLVHGESLVEQVIPGTNRAAIDAGVDILAHPGLISSEEVKLAKKSRVFLELSARKGHCLTNGWLAKLALKHRAGLLVNSDGHLPADLITPERHRDVALGAGLTASQYDHLLTETWQLVEKASARGKPKRSHG